MRCTLTQKETFPVKLTEKVSFKNDSASRLQRGENLVYLRRAQQPSLDRGQIRLVQDERDDDSWTGEYKSNDHYHWLGQRPYDAWEEAYNQGITTEDWSDREGELWTVHFEGTALAREELESYLQERGVENTNE